MTVLPKFKKKPNTATGTVVATGSSKSTAVVVGNLSSNGAGRVSLPNGNGKKHSKPNYTNNGDFYRPLSPGSSSRH
jgi:hypothetical protein